MKGDPVDDDRLCAILEREESQSVGFDDGVLADQQRVAINAYYGRPYGDEEDGRSQFVTRDVAEVVDYMTVAVLRAFVSGDHVVEFEGHPKAKEITAAMHYIFLRKQKGYRIIHDWLKGGLLEKIGVVKTCVEEDKKAEVVQGQVAAEALTQMQEAGEDLVHAEPAGQDENGPVFNVAVRRETTKKTFRDYNVPVEEFRFASRTSDEDTSGYLAHVSRKTRSALVEMGFDPEVVYDLPADQGPTLDNRATSRFADEDTDFRQQASEPANQEVLLCEEYTFVDRDGDGIAERVKAHRVQHTLIEADEVDDQPFVVFCPFPMPGVMVGQSLADKVLDIQKLRTVTTRVTLDGFYLGIAPRTTLDESSITNNTISDLLTVRPGGIIRHKGVAPQPLISTFDPQAGLAMLEFANGERESRTGITRLNQGLDRDALNKTASGTAMMQAQGAQIEEYIARNFGEALARLFTKKLKLMVEFGEPFEVNIDGQLVMVDPKSWPNECDMNVQVGLGTGRKDQRIAYRQAIIGMQAQAKEGGVAIVSDKQFFNSAAGMIADMNLGVPSEYFTDPDTPEGQQLQQQAASRPDPAMAKAQADGQNQAAQLQLDQQKAEADLQLSQQSNQAKLGAMQQESALRLELERGKSAAQIQLDRERMVAEMQLERERMGMEAQFNEAKAQRDHEFAMHQASLTANRPGGDLDK